MKYTTLRTMSRLLSALLGLAFLLSASTSAATITPQYDTNATYQKYWTPGFKAQVTEACTLLAGYINDNQAITIAITIGNATSMNGTFAFADMAKAVGAISTDTKFIAKSGSVTFNPSFYDDAKKDWKGNNIPLMMHEILHCLGFSDTVKAFNRYVNATAQFTGPKATQLNKNVAPALASTTDKSHFKRLVADAAGVYPRMMEGGGQTLSILDLAVLKDIGYDIPTVNAATAPSCLGFKFGPLYAGSYNQEQYTAKAFVQGGCGNDTISAEGATDKIILRGEAGNDTLISGPFATIMIGDDLTELSKGNDGSDIYKIKTNKTHAIVGLGNNDKIYISPSLNITQAQVNAMTVATPDNTYPTYYYPPSNTTTPYFAMKVTIGSLVFYCYSVKEASTDVVKSKIQPKIVISD